jgi:hypothetical protein
MILEQDVGLILGFGDWMGPGFCLVLALALGMEMDMAYGYL